MVALVNEDAYYHGWREKLTRCEEVSKDLITHQDEHL